MKHLSKKSCKKSKKGLTNRYGRAIILAFAEFLRLNKQTLSRHTTLCAYGSYLDPMRVLRMCTAFAVCIFCFLEDTAISTKDLLINEEIRAKEVRVIGVNQEQLGVMSLEKAREYAYGNDVDLVLIAPNAEPPVCRAMDYGKYCFERDKREKEAKKKQQIVKVKEVQLSCRIDTHDFETRVNQAKKFLSGGDKVKAVIRFKGREMAHQDIGREVIEKFRDACREVGSSDKGPVLDGRFLSVLLSPIKPGK